jgi:hypothetical protein
MSATLAPSSLKILPAADAIPPPPPVTITTLPSSLRLDMMTLLIAVDFAQ